VVNRRSAGGKVLGADVGSRRPVNMNPPMNLQSAIVVRLLSLLLLATLPGAGNSARATGADDRHDNSATSRSAEQITSLLRTRQDITILITDSGLGGLSVCAGLEQILPSGRSLSGVRLFFCNALPDAAHGYNTMSSMEEKARVFSDALNGMTELYRPDIILIACNTLSVVYPETEYSKSTTVPVVGIVDIGVDMMSESLLGDSSSCAIIFGTETTIAGSNHRSGLISRGIEEARIVQQACGDLAGEIQVDPASDLVSGMIDMFTEEAVGQLPPGKTGTLVAGLCCTHYGYRADAFKNALESAAGDRAGKVCIVNPNDRMISLFDVPELHGRAQTTDLSVSVVSRAILSVEERESIARLLQASAPLTAKSLRSYMHRPDLFPFSPSDH
jgi:glutamate racemase